MPGRPDRRARRLRPRGWSDCSPASATRPGPGTVAATSPAASHPLTDQADGTSRGAGAAAAAGFDIGLQRAQIEQPQPQHPVRGRDEVEQVQVQRRHEPAVLGDHDHRVPGLRQHRHPGHSQTWPPDRPRMRRDEVQRLRVSDLHAVQSQTSHPGRKGPRRQHQPGGVHRHPEVPVTRREQVHPAMRRGEPAAAQDFRRQSRATGSLDGERTTREFWGQVGWAHSAIVRRCKVPQTRHPQANFPVVVRSAPMRGQRHGPGAHSCGQRARGWEVR